ncbi:betaine/proline/choline family ABC transporter ATP-binding protein [Latilactobacillus sakei]|uniref:betaine/proline/choline family ABC transporter ATP-binding protein n=1 Tax=Latilactobacillus sakei TaxID=1599 RepID=UPI0020C7C3C5|nr:betaine/proline/choline family ABC transporter ATP-binding protein [Latilactobacillus sakei]MCP8855267.1 betaine/proline/choline family ABC transporter ATP-binding protein [Latilactobacillus sakei]
MAYYLEFDHVSKIYRGGNKAVDDISFTVDQGEFICLIGTSGSGKTTTMRMINRMINPTHGTITLAGKSLADTDPVKLRRKIGYVIQNIGLMPHMTIRDNITIVPKLLKWSDEDREKKAQELLKLVELPADFLDRYPSQLSGGQQQRIGVIRALAAGQDIILMDEPFGALDPITREALQDLVKQLQVEMGKTVIFVTHDMDEALKLSSRIAIMDGGKIIQYGTPNEILRQPANDFVKDLIGHDRLLEAKPNVETVGQIMLKTPVTITPDQSLSSAIKLMRQRRVDTLLVVDDQQLLQGLVDLENIDHHYKDAGTVQDIMSTKVNFVNQTDLVRDTIERILKRGWKYVPVVDDDHRLVGIVTRTALVDVVYDAVWGDDEPDNATD